MSLKVGKKYKTKEFHKLTNARCLVDTPYEKDEITVVVERVDTDGDYCLTILDDGERVINEGTGEYFFTNDILIRRINAKFTEIKG